MEKVRIMYMKARKHIYNGHENSIEMDKTRWTTKNSGTREGKRWLHAKWFVACCR